MASLLVPVLYLVLVVGGLVVFSYFYRKRTSVKEYEPWFPSHPERDLYVSLLQQTNPPASDSLLKAALIRRAMADVQRVLRIREDKPALQNLLQKGCVGDDAWNNLLRAEKEMDAELLEVVNEANSFVQGWGQLIFISAGEMVQNEKMRALYENLPKEKDKLEAKYGIKRKFVEVQNALAAPSPASTAPSQTPTPAPATPPPTATLQPPQHVTDADSNASTSDGELVSPPSPASPSKSKSPSGKKGKKRK